MPSLRHCNSSVLVIFDKQLHQFSTSKMKFSKAPELLKKAVTVFKIKAEVLHTKLLIMISLRRRMAMVGTVSRGIRGFVSSDGQEKQPRVEYGDKALILRKAQATSQEPAVATADHGREPSVIDIIRSNREVEGLEFNMDEEIDEACDMFIRRFRKRMNSSF
ncbi:hypothetical protein PR202_ga15306 [Eleusine coracana subsp. coracana]|uniref:Avr9/Cf-9 rapidly elicited protein 146 n=1 Tax=Eleusine coracana subsp. coracana TaxID=191504 RepID=A0AAV5CJD4_ELECO|nr:hypothetical protein PR202_ga15306 [Eleusine coracana subsp. coracana]